MDITTVFPLPVVDVTASHSIDSQNIREIGEEVTGASRLLMGLSNTGRRAATEVQGQLQLSSGRMKMPLPKNCAAHYERMKSRPAVKRVLEQEGLTAAA
jgi:DNA-directed RNA polymerase alpha subunit